MDMTIEIIPTCTVAYIRQTGAYGAQNIKAMERLKHWAKTNGLMNNNTEIFGIAQDDPTATPPKDCRYDACIRIANDCVLDGDMQRDRITGGKYAVFTVAHTAEAVAQAWTDIFPALSAKGYLPDATRPILERYSAEQIAQKCCEICVPLN